MRFSFDRIFVTIFFLFAATLAAQTSLAGDHKDFIHQLFESNLNLSTKLQSFGMDVVFGPSYDTGTSIYNYSRDPHVTAQLAETIRKSWEHSGHLIAVPKHFPGLGSNGDLTHKKAEYFTAEEYQRGLKPFEEAVKNGAKAIMVGHGRYQFQSGRISAPASISKEVVSTLRNTLKFDGVIIADEMLQMSALNGFEHVYFTLSRDEKIVNRYLSALIAGNDMVILYSGKNDNDVIELLAQYVEQSLQQDILSEDNLNASVKRILLLKKFLYPEAQIFKKDFESLLQHMTLKEKVAQTLILSYENSSQASVGMYVFNKSFEKPPWLKQQNSIPTLAASDQRKTYTSTSPALLVNPKTIGDELNQQDRK